MIGWINAYPNYLICNNCGFIAGRHSAQKALCPEDSNENNFSYRNDSKFGVKHIFRAKRLVKDSANKLVVGYVYDIFASISNKYYYLYEHSMAYDASKFEKVEEEVLTGKTSSINEPMQKIANWRAWQHNAPGDCVCGTRKEVCIYHKGT